MIAPVVPISSVSPTQAKSPVFKWSDININFKSAEEANLGFGSFAKVYKAELIYNGVSREVAVKVFEEDIKQGLNYEHLCEKAHQEASTMRDICDKIYPNTNMIALLYGVVEGSLSQDISDLFGFKVRQKKIGIVMRLE